MYEVDEVVLRLGPPKALALPKQCRKQWL